MKKHLLWLKIAAAEGVISAGRCCLLGVCLIFALAGAVDAQPPPARVVVAKVQKRSLDTGRTFVGTVMPLRSSTVASAVESLVDELLVREGDEVKHGQTLARLRDRQLKIQEAAANAEWQVRTQQRDELIKSLPVEIEKAHAGMKAAEALKVFTSARLDRTLTLVKNKVVSEDQLQEVRSAAQAAQEKYREMRLAWELAGAVREEKLLQAKAQVEVQWQEVLRLRDEIAEHTIEAPFDGYVTKEYTEVGQWISKGGPVVEIVRVDRVEVKVFVPESYLPQLDKNTKATVTVEALPGELWEERISAIVLQADVRSRSFPVKVELENRTGTPSMDAGGVLLKPGMFARVTLPVGSKASALMVPKDALVLGGRSPVVFVVDPSGVVRRVPVELGAAVENWIEVRGSLKPGDRVVVEGNERVSPGQAVIVVEPDQSSAAKPAKDASE